jgi:hypothetical protein
MHLIAGQQMRRSNMADEPVNDAKKTTPGQLEKKDTSTEHIERAPATRDTKTAEDVKSDAATEDRFEATDN